MAKPQLENGYFKMANELRQAFARIRIPGEAMQVLWVILGKTYGFNKKSDCISLTQFCRETSLSRTHVCSAIKKLRELNIISTDNGTTYVTKYMINKDYDTWQSSPKKGTGSPDIGTTGSPDIGTKSSPDNGTHKRHILKTRNKDTMASALLTLFGELFKGRFSTKYMASFEKDTRLLKDIEVGLGTEETEKRLRRFFEDDDDFLRTAGHTVGVFVKRVNSYADSLWENRKVKTKDPMADWLKRKQEEIDAESGKV